MRPALKQIKGKNLIIAEIGVYRGVNAFSMLQNLDIKKLYLIDPYKVFDEPSSAMGKDKDFPQNEFIARDLLNDYSDKIVWIKKNSHEAAEHIPMCDLVYIDGSHEYETVLKDLQLYWQKVKRGGLLCGHDYFYKKGVRKAVDEFVSDKKLNIQKPDWWIWK